MKAPVSTVSSREMPWAETSGRTIQNSASSSMNCEMSLSTRMSTITRCRSWVKRTASTRPTGISRKRSSVSPGVMPVASLKATDTSVPRPA